MLAVRTYTGPVQHTQTTPSTDMMKSAKTCLVLNLNLNMISEQTMNDYLFHLQMAMLADCMNQFCLKC